jgi:hypothetical protein
MTDPVYLFQFSNGLVDISVYASDLEAAKRSALIACELMTRQLDRELDREDSELLTGMRLVPPVEIREVA